MPDPSRQVLGIKNAKPHRHRAGRVAAQDGDSLRKIEDLPMVLLARTNGNSNDSQANMIDRPVPYDLAAQEAVLGALLIDRDAIIKIAPFLKPVDFYREANGWIYNALLDLYHRREPA